MLGQTKDQTTPSMPRISGLGVGDEQYLWGLVLLEVAALFLLRSAFGRHHGG